MRFILVAGAAAALLAASGASARTADYGRSEAEFRADSESLKMTPFVASPERGTVDVLLEDVEKLDHRLKILGLYCRAYKTENPLSQMVQRVLGGWDADGQLGGGAAGPQMRVRFNSATSTIRCVQMSELKARCLTRTAISGEAQFQSPGKAARTRPVVVEVQHSQSIGGFCGGLARGAALSGRAATIALVEQLAEFTRGE